MTNLLKAMGLFAALLVALVGLSGCFEDEVADSAQNSAKAAVDAQDCAVKASVARGPSHDANNPVWNVLSQARERARGAADLAQEMATDAKDGKYTPKQWADMQRDADAEAARTKAIYDARSEEAFALLRAKKDVCYSCMIELESKMGAAQRRADAI